MNPARRGLARALPAVAGVFVLAGCGDSPTAPPALKQTLAVGEATTSYGSGAARVTLPANAAGEYLLVLFNASEAVDGRLQVAVSAQGVLSPASASAAPALAAQAGSAAPARVVPDAGFERRLRERERAELSPRLAALRTQGAEPRRSRAAAAAPALGDRLRFNTATSCTAAATRTGRVVALGRHALVVADSASPAGGLTTADYARVAGLFDELIYPTVTAAFGEPSDVDQNGRVVLFFTEAVNALSQPGSGTVVQGFHWAGDLFPRDSSRTIAGCRNSNLAEMLYLMVPDAAWSADYVRTIVPGVVGHELQHLINASTRLYVSQADEFEETWLNEGLSHVAEELLFYRSAGLGPRRDLGAAALAPPSVQAALDNYQLANLDRLARYLTRPEASSAMDGDELSTRGAIWAFLRYAADRRGGEAEFWSKLVGSKRSGLENLRDALGSDPLPVLHDWNVSLYTDNAVPGVDARLTQPSWDFRSALSVLGGRGYALALRALGAGTPLSASLPGGGAWFLRFRAGGAPAVVSVTSGGSTPPRQLRATLVRVE